MKQFKEVINTTIINSFDEVETKTITKLHTIRSWDELSREEQDEEIESRNEDIYYWYQEDLYNGFKCDLDNLKYEFKNIDFEDIYIDSNSQGAWIDSIKGFKYNDEGIDIYGEHLEVYDIDLHIRKYIEKITDEDINVDDYYIDTDKLDRIKETKKYKEWLKSIVDEVNKWIDLANEYCSEIIRHEYDYPYNMDNEEDKEWLDNYFMDEEFWKYEVLDNG